MKENTVENGKVIASANIDLGRKKTGVLHNIYIIDASSSMNYGGSTIDDVYRTKYQVANDGVNNEIAELKKDDRGDVNISLFEFDSAEHGRERITEHYFNTPLKDTKDIQFVGARGNTPLYQTIAYVINKFLRLASNEDTVLIKIFTDGAHNCRWGVTEKDCKALIKDVQDNRDFIITFIGTQIDTEHAIQHLGMERGNTVSYDGSARGAGETFAFMTSNTSFMMEDIRTGKELKSKGFYKQAEDKLKEQKTEEELKKDDNAKI